MLLVFCLKPELTACSSKGKAFNSHPVSISCAIQAHQDVRYGWSIHRVEGEDQDFNDGLPIVVDYPHTKTRRYWKMRSLACSLLVLIFCGFMTRMPQEDSSPVYVTLWLDTEDYILPQSDDAA